MADALKPDLCVIGAGSGGLTVAAAARAFGASVVLIEQGKMGGDCLNTGCVPSKALIAAAGFAKAARRGPEFGVSFGARRVDFGQVHDHIMGVIDTIAPNDSVERFEALGAHVIKAPARFIDKRTVEAGGQMIRARRFVVATGSRPSIPPIEGLEQTPFLTNETIFALKDKPDHLLIIGGGPIGIELAQAYARLGSQVSVIEMADMLSKDDPELTEFVLRRVAEDGVTLRPKTKIVSTAAEDGGVTVTVMGQDGEEVLTGSHLLVATGRTPSVAELGLEAAGVTFSDAGIGVNAHLRTSNRRIFAIGDVVAGGLKFTHVSGYHAGLVVRSALFGLPAREKRGIIPWVTYTDPEIANVGLTEPMARERLGDKFKVVRWSFAENDRAQTERRPEGAIKMITDKGGRIIGCGIVGAQAGELVSLFAFAIANGMKASSLTKYVAPYPTLAEIAKRMGTEYYRDQLGSPWIARWLKLIRHLP